MTHPLYTPYSAVNYMTRAPYSAPVPAVKYLYEGNIYYVPEGASVVDNHTNQIIFTNGAVRDVLVSYY